MVEGAGEGVVFRAFTNTNLYYTNIVIPAVKYPVPVGTSEIKTMVTIL